MGNQQVEWRVKQLLAEVACALMVFFVSLFFVFKDRTHSPDPTIDLEDVFNSRIRWKYRQFFTTATTDYCPRFDTNETVPLSFDGQCSFLNGVDGCCSESPTFPTQLEQCPETCTKIFSPFWCSHSCLPLVDFVSTTGGNSLTVCKTAADKLWQECNACGVLSGSTQLEWVQSMDMEVARGDRDCWDMEVGLPKGSTPTLTSLTVLPSILEFVEAQDSKITISVDVVGLDVSLNDAAVRCAVSVTAPDSAVWIITFDLQGNGKHQWSGSTDEVTVRWYATSGIYQVSRVTLPDVLDSATQEPVVLEITEKVEFEVDSTNVQTDTYGEVKLCQDNPQATNANAEFVFTPQLEGVNKVASLASCGGGKSTIAAPEGQTLNLQVDELKLDGPVTKLVGVTLDITQGMEVGEGATELVMERGSKIRFLPSSVMGVHNGGSQGSPFAVRGGAVEAEAGSRVSISQPMIFDCEYSHKGEMGVERDATVEMHQQTTIDHPEAEISLAEGSSVNVKQQATLQKGLLRGPGQVIVQGGQVDSFTDCQILSSVNLQETTNAVQRALLPSIHHTRTQLLQNSASMSCCGICSQGTLTVFSGQIMEIKGCDVAGCVCHPAAGGFQVSAVVSDLVVRSGAVLRFAAVTKDRPSILQVDTAFKWEPGAKLVLQGFTDGSEEIPFLQLPTNTNCTEVGEDLTANVEPPFATFSCPDVKTGIVRATLVAPSPTTPVQPPAPPTPRGVVPVAPPSSPSSDDGGSNKAMLALLGLLIIPCVILIATIVMRKKQRIPTTDGERVMEYDPEKEPLQKTQEVDTSKPGTPQPPPPTPANDWENVN